MALTEQVLLLIGCNQTQTNVLASSLVPKGSYFIAVVQELKPGMRRLELPSLESGNNRFLYLGIRSLINDMPEVLRKVERQWNRGIDALINFLPDYDMSYDANAAVGLQTVFVTTGAVLTNMMARRLAGEARQQKPGYFDGDIQQALLNNDKQGQKKKNHVRSNESAMNATPFPQLLPITPETGALLDRLTRPRNLQTMSHSPETNEIHRTRKLSLPAKVPVDTKFVPLNDEGIITLSASGDTVISSTVRHLPSNKKRLFSRKKKKDSDYPDIAHKAGPVRTYRIIHFVSSSQGELCASGPSSFMARNIMTFIDSLDTQTASLGVRVFVLDSNCFSPETLAEITNGRADPLSGSLITNSSVIHDMPLRKIDPDMSSMSNDSPSLTRSRPKWWNIGKRNVAV